MNTKRGSIGGVTVGDGWLRNNPDLAYPEGHDFMSDAELKEALRVDVGGLGIIEARMPTAAEIRLARLTQEDCGILPLPRCAYPKPRRKRTVNENTGNKETDHE